MNVAERFPGAGFECVCGNMRMAARAVTSIYNRHLRPVGLQATQLTVLWASASMRSAPVKKVAAMIVMDETTLLRNLGVLARRGLVSMVVGRDRRQRIVEVTPDGQERLAAAMPHWRSAQREVQQALGEGGLQAMNQTLLRLVISIP